MVSLVKLRDNNGLGRKFFFCQTAASRFIINLEFLLVLTFTCLVNLGMLLCFLGNKFQRFINTF